MNSAHIQWLVNTNQSVQTKDGKMVEVWDFNHQSDRTILSGWAKHFREHYCSDSEIDALRNGTGKSRRDYLIDIKFPSRRVGLGPSTRSGDFSEILVADFLEYIQHYWVPRTRYDRKTRRNMSTPGCDVIGFRSILNQPSVDDVLAIYECKSGLSNNRSNRLQDAIDDSQKDPTRKAESLNAIKQRFRDKNLPDQVDRVERFQNEADNPYKQIYGAAAILDNSQYDSRTITNNTDASHHPQKNKLCLLVIKGRDLMLLVHTLYERAADES